jgi:photosystem II stability/assembly factor-like uncharacterized protein
MLCGSTCVDTSSDVYHCGSCDPCPSPDDSNTLCVTGLCRCKPGTAYDTSVGKCVPHLDFTQQMTVQGGGVTFHSVWGSSAKDVYVVGDQSVIFHRGTDGKWTQQPSGEPPTNQSDFYGVWSCPAFSGGYDIYVAGSKGIRHSNGNGSWSSVLDLGAGSGRLLDIWGFGYNDIYAVGDAAMIYHSNDGKMWTLEDSGLGATAVVTQLYAVYGNVSNDVWAVGSLGTLLHTDLNGKWQKMTAPGQTTGAFFGAWSPGGAGQMLVAGQGGAVYYTDSYGSDWKQRTTPLPQSDFHAIWGSGAGDVYLLAIGSILSTPDAYGGGTWTAKAIGNPPPGGGGYFGIWGSSMDDVYVVGSSETSLHHP